LIAKTLAPSTGLPLEQAATGFAPELRYSLPQLAAILLGALQGGTTNKI
jgi:hypothetical protein